MMQKIPARIHESGIFYKSSIFQIFQNTQSLCFLIKPQSAYRISHDQTHLRFPDSVPA